MSSESTKRTVNNEYHPVPAAQPGKRQVATKIVTFALQKIWLPHTLYSLVPFFYLFAGAVALLSTLYMPSWSWFLPYALLAAGIAFHAAIAIGIARYRGYRKMAAMKHTR